MDNRKRAVIIGMVLGDGYIQVRERPRKTMKPYVEKAMRVLHGPTQRQYCEFKAKRLSWALGGKKINVTKVKNGPGGNYDAYQFTVNHPYFGQVRRWMYPGGEKRYTEKVLNMLNPEGIAYWYLDDGSARRNIDKDGWVTSVSTEISTMCSEQEAMLIADWFKAEYGIEWKIRRDKRKSPDRAFYIACNTSNTHEFAAVVGPYVPDCMKYKLSHVAQVKSHERQAPVGECTSCGKTLYAKRQRGLCSTCYSKDLRAMR